jgi:hypothetical protein
MAKVIIEIEGGVVQNVWTDSGDVGEYVIIDRDMEESGEDDYISKFDIGKRPSLTDGHIPAEIEAEIERAS